MGAGPGRDRDRLRTSLPSFPGCRSPKSSEGRETCVEGWAEAVLGRVPSEDVALASSPAARWYSSRRER